MTDTKAMQQALEALELLRKAPTETALDYADNAIEGLRSRLAQPEQKPFCYHDGRNIVGKEFADHSDVFPLYTAPPQREPLSDEECDELWEKQTIHITDKFSAREFIRDVEDAHGIKENT